MIRIFYRFVFLALVLISLIFLESCDTPPNDLGIQLHLEKKTLSNGLTVIFVEDHTVPLVSFQTWYRVGTVDEGLGMSGISHLIERLMFKGTVKYGDRQFFQQLEAKGASIGAGTTRDYTVYYDTFTADLMEKVIDMESDRMQNLMFSDETLNSEKLAVLEEHRIKLDSIPEERMQEALWQLAYRFHPYHTPVLGYPMDVVRLGLEDVQNYYKSHYQPANAAIVMVGDFKTDPAFALIRKYYEKIPAQPLPQRMISAEPPQNEEHRLVLRDDIASARFAEGYHIPSASHPDAYSLDVLANILFEGTTSRAYRRLAEEKDMVVGVSGSAYTPTYPGLFLILGTMKGKLPCSMAEKELDQVIHQIQEKGVTSVEVQTAVKQLTVQLIDSIRTPYGLGQLIGIVQTIFGSPEGYGEDLKKYMQVQPRDVQEVAKKYFDPNNRTIVELLPSTSRE